MLSKEIQAIQQARYELAEENRKARRYDMLCAGAFIKDADLQECLWVVNELIARVADLTGSVTELEDAACALIKEIENNDDSDNICASCNGSGEGHYEGTTCRNCKGKGTV